MRRLIDRLSRNYDRKFSYIEDVMKSCITLDQLDHAAIWASAVMESGRKTEKKKVNDYYFGAIGYFDMMDEVGEYFDLKREIIGLLFDRKVNELERLEYQAEHQEEAEEEELENPEEENE